MIASLLLSNFSKQSVFSRSSLLTCGVDFILHVLALHFPRVIGIHSRVPAADRKKTDCFQCIWKSVAFWERDNKGVRSCHCHFLFLCLPVLSHSGRRRRRSAMCDCPAARPGSQPPSPGGLCFNVVRFRLRSCRCWWADLTVKVSLWNRTVTKFHRSVACNHLPISNSWAHRGRKIEKKHELEGKFNPVAVHS